MQQAGICEETPLGQGSVRWDEYLTALKDIGYNGFLTIEHEIKDKADEIYEAAAFLKKTLTRLFPDEGD